MTDKAAAVQSIAEIGSAAAAPGGFGRRILSLADALAVHSEVAGRLACTYLTPAHLAAAAQLRDWMQGAGLAAHIDAVGNVVGSLRCADPKARTLLVGSHYDTVRDAGKYDGRLGILTGLAVLEHLVGAGVRLPFHVDLIAFAEEEGARFGTSYLGSSALAGRFDPLALARRDASGLAVAEAIRAAGRDPTGISALARQPQDLLCYLEVHIEQGPVLLEAGLPLGIVTAIAGCSRHLLKLTGVAGHAGTVPMAGRHDAAAAAAEMILAVEARCRATPGVVGTVGQLAVPDGAVNVIPGRCELSLDLRADEEEKLQALIGDVLAMVQGIAERRGVALALNELQRAPVVACDPRLRAVIAQSVERAGLPVRYLPSGAGHDAVMLAQVAPVGMLFVRCGNGGVSHSPLEQVSEDDADAAARVLLDVLMNLHDTR